MNNIRIAILIIFTGLSLLNWLYTKQLDDSFAYAPKPTPIPSNAVLPIETPIPSGYLDPYADEGGTLLPLETNPKVYAERRYRASMEIYDGNLRLHFKLYALPGWERELLLVTLCAAGWFLVPKKTA